MSAYDHDRHPYRGSYRADVEELQHALNSPSPLGGILDNYHRSHSRGEDAGEHSNLSPGPEYPTDLHTVKSEYSKSQYSAFGAGSVAHSAVSTIVDGVHHTIAHWKVLLFGQLISLFIALAGAANEELNGTCHVSIPLTQCAIVGVVLMLSGACRMRGWCANCCLLRGRARSTGDADEEEIFCGGSVNGENPKTIRSPGSEDDGDDMFSESGKSDGDGWKSDDDRGHPVAKLRVTPRPHSFCFGLQSIHAPWWAYFCTGLVAVEARYFIFLAFRYTTFTFIYLVAALAIPSAMAFSKCMLQRAYGITHVLGGSVCIGGIVISTVSDLKGHDIENIGSKGDVDSLEHLKGDVLAISGAILLGLDDVISEALIKDYPGGGEHELLFTKWLFGLCISITQLLFLGGESFSAVFENRDGDPCDIPTRLLLLGGYTLFQALDMYSEVRFLGVSEAALLNLSLLTSNLWATAFSVLAVGLVPSGLYFAALVLIVAGIVLYEAGPSPISGPAPSDIRITVRNVESEVGEHGDGRRADGIRIGGQLEMT